jgi:uncharacterized protein YdaL
MKTILVALAFLISGSAFAQVINLQTIYTQDCQSAAMFYELVAQKTNGALVFNVQCGGYGYSPGGNYLQMLYGTVSAYAYPGTTIQLSTIYTNSCDQAVDFYQLIAQKTNGAIIFNVQCGAYGTSPGGDYLQMLYGTVAIHGQFGQTLPLAPIYTQNCQTAEMFYRLVAQKTNGALVFNVQCGGYGYSPGGNYLQMLNGTVSIKAYPGTTIQLSTIYTDSCDQAVDFYQLVAQKTNGAIVFNVQCGGYGTSPGGNYLQTLTGTVTFQ